MSGSCSGPGFSSAGLWINAQLLSYIDYKSVAAIQQVLLSLFTLKATRCQKKHNFYLMLECCVLTGKGREEGGQGWTSAGGVMVISDALVGADLSRGALGDVA